MMALRRWGLWARRRREAGAPSRRNDESGFAGGADGLVFGLLIFVVGTILVANAWAVVDTKMAADSAARQAVRAYVEAPDPTTAAAEAQQSADEALLGYGRTASRASLSLSSGAYGRCQRVTIEVHYRAALVELPLVGNLGAAETVTAQHSELIDPYRSGLPGTALCA
jgi:hypothetical protein